MTDLIKEGARVRFLERDENPCPPDGLLDGMLGTVMSVEEGWAFVEFRGTAHVNYEVELQYLEVVA